MVKNNLILLLFREVKAKCKHSLNGSLDLVKEKVLSSFSSTVKSFLIAVPSCSSNILSA